MAFVVKLFFVAALVYSTNGGYLNGQHSGPDSFLSSALSAPSANFGRPSATYGAPQQDIGHGHQVTVEESIVDEHPHTGAALPGIGSIAADSLSHGQYSGNGYDGYGNGLANQGSLLSGPATGPSGSYGPPALSGPSGNGYNEGSLLLDSTLPGPANGGNGIGPGTIGAPRVIGTTVSVGRPDESATRYELQSVVQNVIRRIPVEVTRHVQVAVPHPVPVPVRQEVKVPVPQPYPVHVDVVKHVPYPVYKTEHVPVERPVPVEVVKEVPVEVIKKVHIPIDRPYEVIKKVHVPVEKRVEVPVAVWKPYPLHIIKHVTHYKKKSCCW